MTHYLTWNNPRTVVVCAMLLMLAFLPSSVSAQDFTITTTADFDAGTKTDMATETDLYGVSANTLQKDVYGPEGDIVIQAIGTADATVGDVGDTEYWRGQSFNESYSGYLTSVLFFFELHENSPNNVSVHIYSDDGSGLPDAQLATTNNYSSNAGWPNHIGSPNNFVVFTLDKPYPMTADTKYHAILQTEGDSPTGGRYIFSYEDNDVYSNGDWISSSDGGSSWSKQTGFDMRMILRCKDYGGEEVQATPYPVSENEQSPVSAVLGDKAYNNGGGPPTTNGWKWYEYDPATDTFTQVANVPNGTGYPRHAGSAVADGTYAYFIGGGKTINEVVPYTHRYNVVTDSWSWMANMTYGVADTCALFYENGTYDQIFMVGGINSTIDAGTKSPAPYVQIYNITDDSWHEGANMTQYRAWICPVLINDKIYVVGGANETTGTETLVPADDLYIYDIVTNAWSTGTSFPRNVYRHSALNIDDKLYTFGGVKQDYQDLPNQTIRTVWEYDPGGDSWDYAHIGINRTWGAVALLSDGIHYFAGSQEGAGGDVYVQTDDHFIINGTSSATWESAAQTMTIGYQFRSLTIKHTVATSYSISEVYIEVNSVEKARWSTDITSGASTTLTESELTSGSLVHVNADYTVVIKFTGVGGNTPMVTQIYGYYTAPKPEKIVCDFQPTIDTFRVSFAASCNRDDALIFHWIWDFGDGTTLYDDDNTTEHVYSEGGSYNVSLEVIDHDGRTVIVSKTITVGEEDSTSGFFWPNMGRFCCAGGAIILLVILAALVRQRRKKEEDMRPQERGE